MKKIYILSFLLLLSSSNILSQSGWFWQNPLPQGNELLSGMFVNSNYYAAGVSGTFIKSSNNGAVWDILPLNTGSYLRSIFFINDVKGWVISNQLVFRTLDGGSNWQNDSIVGSGTLNSVFFANENIGYITVETGKIYKSTNGGLNWNLLYSVSGTSFTNIYFINENTGWVTDYYNKVYKTVNGGVNWAVYTTSSANRLTSILFIDSNTGWMTNETGGRRLVQHGCYDLATTSFTAPVQPLCVRSKTMPSGSLYLHS